MAVVQLSAQNPIPRNLRPSITVVAVIALFDLILVSDGTLNLFKPFGPYFAYNSMALHMLTGHFDVDPSSIGGEAFVRDGRTYAYFGIFPALLRLPLVPFLDMNTVRVERLSCWLAMILGTCGQVVAIQAATAPSRNHCTKGIFRRPMLVAAMFSGPAVMLGWSASLYHEAILWAWALAMVFVALAVHAMVRAERFSAMVLTSMTTIAGLCLLSRPTTGLGLYSAVALIMLLQMLKSDDRSRSWVLRIAARVREPGFWLPLLITAIFAFIAGFVNYARWGNPLTFADLRAQTPLDAIFPDRLVRLDNYGLFNVARLPLGVMYYFFPIWTFQIHGHFLFRDSILELFDAFERPASSFFLSDPMTMVLAISGGALLIRGALPGKVSALARMLVLGLAIPPFLMLIAWFMAFRYRAEFMPLMVALACIAAAYWPRYDGANERRARRGGQLLWALCILQILSAHVYLVLYAMTPNGSSDRYSPGLKRSEIGRGLPVTFGCEPACGPGRGTLLGQN